MKDKLRSYWLSGCLMLARSLQSFKNKWFLLWIYVAVFIGMLYHKNWAWSLALVILIVRLCFLGPKCHRRNCLLACLVLSTWCLGKWGWQYYEQSQLNQRIEPDIAQNYQVILAPSQVKHTATGWQGIGYLKLADGRLLTLLAKGQGDIDWDLGYEVMEVKGQASLKEAERARNFGVYDYHQSLADKGIDWVLDFKSVTSIEAKPLALGLMEALRQWFLAPLARWKGQGSSWTSLVLRLLFNQQTPGFRDQSVSLGVLGLSHFFAISGFHLLYLRRVLSRFFLRLGCLKESVAFWLPLFLLFYSWLCGWPIGSIRVLGSWGLVTFSKHFGDQTLTSLDRLSLVGLACLLSNPGLVFQPAYLLSFVLSVVLIFSNQAMDSPKHYSWRHQVYMLLACLLITWPLMMDWRYEWYPLQVLAIFLLGIVFEPLIMPLALVSSLTLILPGLDRLASLMDGIYQVMLGMLSPIGKFFSWHVITGRLSFIYWFIFLILFLVWLRWGWHHPWTTGAVLVCAYGLILGLKPYLHWQSSLTILDVGQGDSLVYQAAWSKEAWLIDTGGRPPYPASKEGPSFDTQYGYYNLIPALKAQGIGSLTGVMITHSDLDHIGSLASLSQEVAIDNLWISQHTASHPVWQEIKPYLAVSTQVHVLGPGQVYSIKEGLTFYTNDFNQATAPNDASIAATLAMGRHRLLNLGDMSGEYEQALIEHFPEIQADILKCAHHGSRFSSSDALLNHVHPKLALLSAGVHNTYHHPHPDTLAKLSNRGIPYFATPYHGAIRYEWSDWGWENWRTVLEAQQSTYPKSEPGQSKR